MKHWKVTYKEKGEDGDIANVHVYADTKEGAEAEARSEYWDIERIIQTIEIK